MISLRNSIPLKQLLSPSVVTLSSRLVFGSESGRGVRKYGMTRGDNNGLIFRNRMLASKEQWSRLDRSPKGIVYSEQCDNCSGYQHQFRGIRTQVSYGGAQQKADEDEEILGRGEKIIRTKLSTTRVDAVLKAGLGLSRNKIEKVLYDDRVRVNGVRPKKKSEVVYEGDEIDIVRGYNKLNPDFIDVSRVEILELQDPNSDERDSDDSDDEGSNTTKIPAKLRRSRLLTIKNYQHPWKGSDMEN